MENNIKDSFTIQDLELLSGIKAHTIRIWEKRYGLLNPKRINRNIRVYALTDLQKLLNVTLLYDNGHKISKIASYDDAQLIDEAKLAALENVSSNYSVNSLIISMYTLDERLFEEVYMELIAQNSFEKLFLETYLPLLEQIGVLWQTNVIKPAHERFISNLLSQKIVLNTASLVQNAPSEKLVHVLFLPKGEMHEIGLLYLNYHLKSKGCRTVYLGSNIPVDDLLSVNGQFNEINWYSLATIDKLAEDKENVVNQLKELGKGSENQTHLIGQSWLELKDENSDGNLNFHQSLSAFLHIC